jgi:uncharacterized phosphosugar-binding protein
MSTVNADQATEAYIERVHELLENIRTTQRDTIRRAAMRMADSIAKKRWVYLFGSGHSVIPVLDVFPRYGSYVGFYPLLDPRLMWWNVLGPGGAPGLLWLERAEGYVTSFLSNFSFREEDTLLVYSHGGLNAAPIEAGLYARERGCAVIAITSVRNHDVSKATHSSGKKLADLADIVIDNCIAPEDSLIDIGVEEKVAAGSTVSVILISMALVAETAAVLSGRGVHLDTFVSPNVPGVAPDHNERVFERFRERIRETT